MSKLYWLLDLWYETDEVGTNMHLYCIDEQMNRVEVVDSSVRPRFYAEGQVGLFEVSKIRGYVKHEYVKRKHLGVEYDMTQIFTRRPMDVSFDKMKRIGARYDIESLGYKTHSADVFFDEVYMTARGIAPCSWFEMDDKGNIKPLDKKSAPPDPFLKKLAFDCEMYNKLGWAIPERDPLVCLGVKTDSFSKMLVADVNQDPIDYQLLKDFVQIFKVWNPDVDWTYYGDTSDFPFLIDRCDALGIPFDLGRGEHLTLPTKSQYSTISIRGRANIDAFNYADNYCDSRSNVQGDVYESLFGARSDYPIDRDMIWDYWDRDMHEEITRHCMADVQQTFAIGEHSLGFGKALAYLTVVPIDQVFCMMTSRALEQGMFNFALKFNEVIPNIQRGVHRSYSAALTFPPLPGLWEDAYNLDFSGMYMNQAIKHNISPDTIDPNGDIVVHDEKEGNNIRFKSSPKGFYVDMAETFLGERKRLKDMKVTDKSMDFAIKTLCAASTGYFGWVGARWHNAELIRAICAAARHVESRTRTIAQREGWTVLYGDTDSTFVVDDKKKGLDVDKLIKTIIGEVGFLIKVDDHFKRIGFGNAKKRYFGLTEDDRIIVKGLESIRGDWVRMAQESQRKVIDLVLRDGDIKGAIQFANRQIQRLKTFTFEIDEVTIHKGMRQAPEDYATRSAHVEVAKRLGLKEGDKVDYVIRRGYGNLSDKAVAVSELRNIREIDVDYYIQKQVAPAVIRILGNIMYKKAKTIAESR